METQPKKRKIKFSNSFSVYDCYKLLRKNKWYNCINTVPEKDFYAVIRGVNLLLADILTDSNKVTLPYKMGSLELLKRDVSPKFINNQLKITSKVDWKKTNELWKVDPEARENKILIRYNSKYTFLIHYDKAKAVYKNKSFIKFSPARSLKIKLKNKILTGKIDAFEDKNYDWIYFNKGNNR